MGRLRLHKLVNCTCPCGNSFQENENRIQNGRGKYCSKKCMYKYRVRPSDLKYKIKKQNPAWFKKGVIPATAWKSGDTAGPKNANWKGGVTDENERIRKKDRTTAKYKKWRFAVFKRDDFTCAICGEAKSGRLQADHIKPYSLFPELRYDLSNGRTLCEDCHKKTDTYGGRIRTWVKKQL